MFRGIETKINPETYAEGKTITWHQFSSCTKSELTAAQFLAGYNPETAESALRLSGTLFVLEIKTGKEISAFSSFEEEEEVLMRFNTFLRVQRRLCTHAEKRACLVGLAAVNIDLSNVDVYMLQQL